MPLEGLWVWPVSAGSMGVARELEVVGLMNAA